jgi:hypothetical protein
MLSRSVRLWSSGRTWRIRIRRCLGTAYPTCLFVHPSAPPRARSLKQAGGGSDGKGVTDWREASDLHCEMAAATTAPPPPTAVRTVYLTGGSGYLGGELMRVLATSGIGSVVLPVCTLRSVGSAAAGLVALRLTGSAHGVPGAR